MSLYSNSFRFSSFEMFLYPLQSYSWFLFFSSSVGSWCFHELSFRPFFNFLIISSSQVFRHFHIWENFFVKILMLKKQFKAFLSYYYYHCFYESLKMTWKPPINYLNYLDNSIFWYFFSINYNNFIQSFGYQNCKNEKYWDKTLKKKSKKPTEFLR